MVSVTDGLPYLIDTPSDLTDSHFSGLPYAPAVWPTLNMIWLLLILAWVGLICLTAYALRVNPPARLPEMDTDSIIVLTAWVGLILLTTYALRITHGP